MMGTVLYQVAERFGTIFLKEIAIWATRPLDPTLSPCAAEFHMRVTQMSE
jgi:hypothetical protein